MTETRRAKHTAGGRFFAALWQGAAGIAVVIAVWYIAAAVYDKPVLLPSPHAALAELGGVLTAGWFWRGVAGSLSRAALAFVVSALLAAFFAFVGKACPAARRVFAPIIGVLRSVPTMSVILIALLWWGEDATPPIVAGLVVFPVLYSGLDAAFGAIDPELEETALLYAPNAAYRFARVWFPLAMPAFVRVAGGAAGMTLKLTVAAEVLAQTRESIGLLMQQTRLYFQIGQLMAITVVVVALSLAVEAVFAALYKLVRY